MIGTDKPAHLACVRGTRRGYSITSYDSRRKEVQEKPGRANPCWFLPTNRMVTNKLDPKTKPHVAPLALHIRSLRLWYGNRGISQDELSELAGVSDRVLRKYETSRVLPESLACLLSVAIALEVPPEDLVDPRQLAGIKAGIESRRKEILARCAYVC